jgi:hypothetical protein
MKLVFFRQIFEVHKYKISWKSVQWEPSCSMRTDRHDGANSSFSQFYECALKANLNFACCLSNNHAVSTCIEPHVWNTSRILKLSSKWRWVDSFTPSPNFSSKRHALPNAYGAVGGGGGVFQAGLDIVTTRKHRALGWERKVVLHLLSRGTILP